MSDLTNANRLCARVAGNTIMSNLTNANRLCATVFEACGRLVYNTIESH